MINFKQGFSLYVCTKLCHLHFSIMKSSGTTKQKTTSPHNLYSQPPYFSTFLSTLFHLEIIREDHAKNKLLPTNQSKPPITFPIVPPAGRDLRLRRPWRLPPSPLWLRPRLPRPPGPVRVRVRRQGRVRKPGLWRTGEEGRGRHRGRIQGRPSRREDPGKKKNTISRTIVCFALKVLVFYTMFKKLLKAKTYFEVTWIQIGWNEPSNIQIK